MIASHDQFHDVGLDLNISILRDGISLLSLLHASLNFVLKVFWLHSVDDLNTFVNKII